MFCAHAASCSHTHTHAHTHTHTFIYAIHSILHRCTLYNNITHREISLCNLDMIFFPLFVLVYVAFLFLRGDGGLGAAGLHSSMGQMHLFNCWFVGCLAFSATLQ